MDHFEVTKLLKEKKFWFASILVVWAAGLQGQMMWLQRQDTFKQKFGNLDQELETFTQAASVTNAAFSCHGLAPILYII